MKRLQILGSLLLSLVMVACVLAPAEVQAIVPTSLHDFVFSTDSITCAAGVVFTGISRKARGLANLGGLKQVILYA
ncbi:MAG: hypothetical protein EOO39_41805, partial [Cytophagaceae bacterium]